MTDVAKEKSLRQREQIRPAKSGLSIKPRLELAVLCKKN